MKQSQMTGYETRFPFVYLLMILPSSARDRPHRPSNFTTRSHVMSCHVSDDCSVDCAVQVGSPRRGRSNTSDPHVAECGECGTTYMRVLYYRGSTAS